MTERKKPIREPIIDVYEDSLVKLQKDSKQWIITNKTGNDKQPKYFTYLPFMLQYIANLKFEDKILNKGIQDALNLLYDIKRDIRNEISLIGSAIIKSPPTKRKTRSTKKKEAAGKNDK